MCVHLLADVHSAVFAPAFTLSFHDSECTRKPPMAITSVVSQNLKKQNQLISPNIDNYSRQNRTTCFRVVFTQTSRKQQGIG